jgi:hypothetical protein
VNKIVITLSDCVWEVNIVPVGLILLWRKCASTCDGTVRIWICAPIGRSYTTWKTLCLWVTFLTAGVTLSEIIILYCSVMLHCADLAFGILHPSTCIFGWCFLFSLQFKRYRNQIVQLKMANWAETYSVLIYLQFLQEEIPTKDWQNIPTARFVWDVHFFRFRVIAP